jgi:site-specific recombinase
MSRKSSSPSFLSGPFQWARYFRLRPLLARAPGLASWEARVQWFESLLRWVRAGAYPENRLESLLDVLETDARLSQPALEAIVAVLNAQPSVSLFARTGLAAESGFFTELGRRLTDHLLPRKPRRADLADTLTQVLPSRSDAGWISRLPDETVARTRALLGPEAWCTMRGSIPEAILLLASRVRAIGLRADLRERGPDGPLRSSPLYALATLCEALLAESPEAAAEAATRTAAVRQGIRDCRTVLSEVLLDLERFGASLTLVYELEHAERSLARLETLLLFMTEEEPERRLLRIRAFIHELAIACRTDRSVRHLFSSSLVLLARKITEHAGSKGEHYITRTRAEYRRMLLAAGGGGLLTSLTAALKFLIAAERLPVLVHLIVSGWNYAASFLLMQALGFRLATKQPSVTAAALAGKIQEHQRHSLRVSGSDDPRAFSAIDADEFAAEVARITRSQFAAAAGNLLFVIPAAWAIDQGWRQLHGRPFLDLEPARYAIASLDPIHTLTLPFAALTGILLWLTSVLSGWIDNWIAYRQVPTAIRESTRLHRLVGRRLTSFAAGLFERQFATAVGNVTLGFLLAFPAVLGAVTGLPIDVRHVTLSTGALTLGVSAVGWDGVTSEALRAAGLGILGIGLLNFGVSFALALATAMRAREVNPEWRWTLLGSAIRRFARRPLEFFWPT